MNELYLLLLKESTLDKQFAKNVLNTKYDVIGVKIPTLKRIAKQYLNYDFTDINTTSCYEIIFLYFYINLFNLKNDINKQVKFILDNIHYVDTWAIVDSTCQLLKNINMQIIYELVHSEEVFVKRYGYVSMLNLIKDEKNLKSIFSLIDSDERYYVLMAEGWLLSYGLIYHFEKTYSFIKEGKFSEKIKKIAIQKAIDSYRVSSENKDLLKMLRNKIKNN